jgi:hypothetical protein
VNRLCEYSFKFLWRYREIFDESLYTLINEIKVRDYKMVVIMNEILQFLFNNANKSIVIGNPRLSLLDKLPILRFFYEPTGKLPPFFLSKTSNHPQEAA